MKNFLNLLLELFYEIEESIAPFFMVLTAPVEKKNNAYQAGIEHLNQEEKNNTNVMQIPRFA